MSIWFTSDHHWGHSNIIQFSERPFGSTDEMDQVLIDNWNRNVMPDDTVYYLGDMCMGRFDYTLDYIKRLNGKIILIPGNHDKCWIGRSKHYSWEPIYLDAGIDQIVQTGAGHPEPTIEIAGQTVKLSHFPYVGDSHELKYGDKFSAYRPEDDGSWLLHGHIHNNGGMNPRQDHMINVGIDVWEYMPVHIDWVAELMDGVQ